MSEWHIIQGLDCKTRKTNIVYISTAICVHELWYVLVCPSLFRLDRKTTGNLELQNEWHSHRRKALNAQQLSTMGTTSKIPKRLPSGACDSPDSAKCNKSCHISCLGAFADVLCSEREGSHGKVVTWLKSCRKLFSLLPRWDLAHLWPSRRGTVHRRPSIASELLTCACPDRKRSIAEPGRVLSGLSRGRQFETKALVCVVSWIACTFARSNVTVLEWLWLIWRFVCYVDLYIYIYILHPPGN